MTDFTKQSRGNRRQKRTWKRQQPKKTSVHTSARPAGFEVAP